MITAIANLSLTSGIFPDRCRQAIIRPLLKKPNLNPEELKNYRPVSNIHFLSKIIEKLVVVRIEEHLINNTLHDPFQSAYRHCHLTETAVLKLHNDIVGGLDIELCTVLASLDLSAAFDTVNHNIFITRLNTEFQISGTIIQWFKSYLDARHHNVCINDDYSRSHTSSCGVPQGSVLGARMFTMYMRPLSAIMNKHGVSYHSYADDIQLYLKCGNNDISVDDTISRLEMCIRDICKWMSQNSLKLNEDKTNFIIFSPKHNQFTTKVINVGANKIPSSEYIKIIKTKM